MRLLIDCGNSRLKWVYADAPVWQPQAVVHAGAALDAVATRAFADQPQPDSIWFACVSGEAGCGALSEILQRRFGIAPNRVRAAPEAFGVRNRYARPELLGADRWAALIAARVQATQACVVADCGTAVTLDALNADGEFVGGVILPGLKLARESLARAAPALDVAPGNNDDCQARATADAVAAGTRYGIIGAIERVTHEFEQVLGPVALIVTGGDGPLFVPLIRRPVWHEPDLVLKGLARIAAL